MLEDKKSTSPLKSNGTKSTSRFKKQGGWADETQKNETQNRAFSALEKRFSSIKLKKQDSEEDVPAVPASMDQSNEDQMELNTSNLNMESHKRAAAYKELNANSNSKQNLAQFLDGVDLRILTKNILPESQLKEVDIPWNWDVLFTELLPELSFNRDKT